MSTSLQAVPVNHLRDLLSKDTADDVIILDVRTRAEHGGEHIVGTTNIPLDEIGKHTHELSRYKHVYQKRAQSP